LWSTQPRSGFAGGGGVLLRYDFLAVPHVVPFVEVGGGMVNCQLGLNDQDDGFAFTLHGGFGARWFFAPQTALGLAYRWQHLSNGGTHLPNDGVDLSEVLLGISYFVAP
jgi:opacity protein-like surface antigen